MDFTIFACPKPFRGHAGVIQRNAIRSWALLASRPEVILLGSDEGVAEIAAELGLRHIPGLELSTMGTPLISDIFSKASGAARTDWLCYVNSDIILMDGLADAAGRVAAQMPSCLAVGRRWDLDVTRELDYQAGWQGALAREACEKGKMHSHTGIDYFFFPKGQYANMPPFAVGRAGWDNWLIYSTIKRGIPVVDITSSAVVVHQSHDYSHVKGGKKAVFKTGEAVDNVSLAGGEGCLYTIRDSTHELVTSGIRRRRDPLYALYRWLYSLSALRPLIMAVKSVFRPWYA